MKVKNAALMIDSLSLLVSHGLILLAAWRLLSRDDLDADPQPDMDTGNGGDAADA